MNKNYKFKLISLVCVVFSLVLFSQELVSSKQPIYLHEQISRKTTKAWDPFLNPIIGEGKVVLKFFAYYCGPCRAMSPHIDKLAGEMHDFTFVKVQWEMFDILTKRFNIQRIPTLIFLNDGKEIGRYDGGPVTHDQLAEIIKTVYQDQ